MGTVPVEPPVLDEVVALAVVPDEPEVPVPVELDAEALVEVLLVEEALAVEPEPPVDAAVALVLPLLPTAP